LAIKDYETFEVQLDKLFIDNKAGKMAGEYVRKNTGATEMIIKTLIN